MSNPPVRLALIDGPEESATWKHVSGRLRRGSITTVVGKGRSTTDAVGAVNVVNSLKAAIKKHSADFDAVVIRSPLQGDGSAIRLAAEAGKHVLVDAPVAADRHAAGEAVAACEQAGVTFAVGRTDRMLPSNQTIKARLVSGKLGAPGLLRIHRWREKDSSPSSFVERLYGDVDLAVWLFGVAPTRIYAIGRLDGAYLQIHFGFPGDGMAVLDLSSALPAGAGYDSVSMIGSKGAAYSDDHHNTHLLYGGGQPSALISGPGIAHLAHELQGFVDSISRKTAPGVGAGDCQTAHRVVEAVKQSIDGGKVLQEKEGGYEPV